MLSREKLQRELDREETEGRQEREPDLGVGRGSRGLSRRWWEEKGSFSCKMLRECGEPGWVRGNGDLCPVGRLWGVSF